MRVLEVLRGFGRGGVEAAFVRRLSFQPVDVETVVLSTVPGLDDLRSHVLPHVSRVVDLDAPMLRTRPLLEAIRRIRPDVVVTHAPKEALRTLWLAERLGAPVVVVAHFSSSTARAGWPDLVGLPLRAVNHRAALHLAVSPTVAEGSQCKGAAAIEVMPLGADASDEMPLTTMWPGDTRLRWLALSRLVWFKNLVVLIAAISDVAPVLRAAGAHVVIAGDGPEARAIRDAIEQRGVADLVSMVGETDRPLGALAAADALLMSSISEGGPITVFEAALAGARVLATPTGVAPMVLKQDTGSVLARSSDRGALAEALLALVALGPVTGAERQQRRSDAACWSSAFSARQFYAALRRVVV